jgi:hypothetical protein
MMMGYLGHGVRVRYTARTITPAMNALLKNACFFLIAFSAFGQLENPSPAEKYAEGQTALAAGRYEEAQRAYEKLRELEPRVAEVHANLG